MAKSTWLWGLVACAACAVPSAMSAEQTQGPSININQAASQLHYGSGNDRMRVEISPNYSDALGWSLKGAAGAYLSDSAAMGLLVEYGDNKREYLSNLGMGLSEQLSLVGTVGMLEEHDLLVDGQGRQAVRQMEYGASLKGNYDHSSITGFELNGYLADADTSSDSVEVGKLYGVQLLASFGLNESTRVKIGGGHEWLRWASGEGEDSRFTLNAEGTGNLSDNLGIHARAKLGVSEDVYGGGLSYALGETGLSSIGLNYVFIDGRNDIEDDQRVMLGWTIGLASNADTQMGTHDALAVQPATAPTKTVTANNLLTDVMKRPTYLPERVLARAAASGSCSGLGLIMNPFNDPANPNKFGVTTGNPAAASISIISTTALPASITIGSFTLAGVSLTPPTVGSYYTVYLLTVPAGTFVPGDSYTMTLAGAVNCQQVVQAISI